MRRISYIEAMKLGGFIGGREGEHDRIPVEPETDWGEFLGRFDTVLMGRRWYGAALAVRKYVFSQTLAAAEPPAVMVAGGDVSGALQSIRSTDGKEICLFGGGVLFRSLLELGEVDPQVRLELAATRRCPRGIMSLTYDVVKTSA